MLKLGLFVGENNWRFLSEIYTELSSKYSVEVFNTRIYKSPILYERLNGWALRRTIKSLMERSDVCFFEWASELLTIASHLPKQCKIVTRLHRFEMYRWVDRINWDSVDKIILVSEAKREEFIAKFPEQEAKIAVIPSSVSLEKFSFSNKKFEGDIGILCDLTPRKRVYDLILAFYELLQKQNKFHLHIGGGMVQTYEDYFEALHYLVNVLQLSDKVTFYGNVIEPVDWYKKIDIFISNSYSEGLQAAPIEAIASGCYCLSHRWNGSIELLPEKYLYFTSSELHDLILNYYHMSETQKQEQRILLRAIAIEKFDIKTMIREINRVVEEVSLA
jgi:glycosyltransferase involved in cell wall biosynthesis